MPNYLGWSISPSAGVVGILVAGVLVVVVVVVLVVVPVTFGENGIHVHFV
jgi:hypothetical protein